ncbi:alpha/beta hydrolase [Acuticoccus sp. M5D2P5]|uniref:alpha/beta fold hydrolase n=1 Tax=Acuticoccus kalidii TaxID=2910977 RepID=UPI001F25928E|nr:alpha/beta hydrolase [Acuticoccus kalidii]MCF3935791.1 alpha/beta hydrolase [Acuticoccus kalidii]
MTTFDVTTADGAVLKASREGEGPALLLVSGLGGTASFWGPTVPALSKDFEVIRFDQRGIGASSRGTATCDIACLASDALAVLDEAGIETATLLGHSTGGCIGQAVAHQAGHRLDGLILSATWLRPSVYMGALFETRLSLLDLSPEAYAGMAALLSYPPEWLEENIAQYENAVARAPSSEVARKVVRERIHALLAFDGSASTHLVSMKTLVLGALDDVVVPAFLQRALAEALPGPELVLYPDGGHFFPVSRTERFVETVRAFGASR